MVTMQEVRAKYPNPVRAWSGRTSLDYCVGGGFCKFIGYTHLDFPRPSVIAYAVREVNPSIDHPRSFNIAKQIINANDDQDFERAWKILDDALNYRGEAET